jgi:hypothetical protein
VLFAAGDAARAAVIAGATGLLLAGCSGDDGVAADCDAGRDVLAVTQIGEGVEGLAEVVVADGGRSEVVTGDWVATNPSFAPNGRGLVVVRANGDYESAGPASTSLWVLDPDWSDPERLTEEGALDDEPHWSPDGSTIAYATASSSGMRRIMVVPAAGGRPRPLLPDGPGDDHAPAWSPDGERIAWVSSEQRTSDRSWIGSPTLTGVGRGN